MNLKSLMVLGPLVGLCWSLWLSPAAALGVTDCDSLDIHVAPAVAGGTVECHRGGRQGGDNGNATMEVIEAKAPLSLLVVTHLAAGVHTYIERMGLENYISRITRFAKTDGWTLAPARQRFLVSRFTATFEAGMPSVPCFAFERYEGHVSQSTGYRHFVAGWYCDFVGAEVLDAASMRFWARSAMISDLPVAPKPSRPGGGDGSVAARFEGTPVAERGQQENGRGATAGGG